LTAQLSEPRPAPASGANQPNIQDVFLNYARRDKLTVVINLLDGRQLEGRIKNFDRFAVIVEVNDADQLLFKHAIATIETGRSMANYFAQNP
jgi:host factor-I protein